MELHQEIYSLNRIDSKTQILMRTKQQVRGGFERILPFIFFNSFTKLNIQLTEYLIVYLVDKTFSSNSIPISPKPLLELDNRITTECSSGTKPTNELDPAVAPV